MSRGFAGNPPPWRCAPVPPPDCREGRWLASLATRVVWTSTVVRRADPTVMSRPDNGAERAAPVTLQPVACAGASATMQPVVREGGLRVVVAADLSARLPAAR